MSVKIRLARGGAKKRPYYRMVVADVRAPRDGSFIEKVGTYNPLLNKDDKERVTIKADRIEHWLSKGAQPTERVAKFIKAAGVKLPEAIAKKMQIKEKVQAEKAKKLAAEKKAAEAAKKAEEAKAAAEAKAAEEAEKAAEEAAAPAEEAPAEEAKPEEAAKTEEEKPSGDAS